MATGDQARINYATNGIPQPALWDNVAGLWVPPHANSKGDQLVQQRHADLWVTATATAGTAVTLTLPAPGAGLFQYLVWWQIVLYAAAALAGGASPQLITTTNLPGNPVFTMPTALAIGQFAEQKYEGQTPIKASVANTPVTFVTPSFGSAIYRLQAAYFTAQ